MRDIEYTFLLFMWRTHQLKSMIVAPLAFLQTIPTLMERYDSRCMDTRNAHRDRLRAWSPMHDVCGCKTSLIPMTRVYVLVFATCLSFAYICINNLSCKTTAFIVYANFQCGYLYGYLEWKCHLLKLQFRYVTAPPSLHYVCYAHHVCVKSDET